MQLFLTIYAVLENKVGSKKIDKQYFGMVIASFTVSFISRLRSSSIDSIMVLSTFVELLNQLIFLKINCQIPSLVLIIGANFARAIIDTKLILTYYQLFSSLSLITALRNHT